MANFTLICTSKVMHSRFYGADTSGCKKCVSCYYGFEEKGTDLILLVHEPLCLVYRLTSKTIGNMVHSKTPRLDTSITDHAFMVAPAD
jgi:hypothetical protein